MDFAFSRRVALKTKAVELDVLLAKIGAAQAAGPTARAQQRLITQDKAETSDNPRLTLFADPEQGAPTDSRLASFAPAFSVRQPK